MEEIWKKEPVWDQKAQETAILKSGKQNRTMIKYRFVLI